MERDWRWALEHREQKETLQAKHSVTASFCSSLQPAQVWLGSSPGAGDPGVGLMGASESESLILKSIHPAFRIEIQTAKHATSSDMEQKSTKRQTKVTTTMKFQLQPLAAQTGRRVKSIETAPTDTISLFQQQRIALSTHYIYISCLKAWWEVLQPCNSSEDLDSEEGAKGYLSQEQYLDLSVRLQKSLLLDFEYESACEKAQSDWQLDSNAFDLPDSEDTGAKLGFAGLSEFLLDLVQELSPSPDPVPTLYVLNAVMLNVRVTQISSGSFLRSSLFKDVRDIQILPKVFFESLQLSPPDSPSLDFAYWFRSNFSDLKGLIASITARLQALYPSDVRVADIWSDPVESLYGRMVLESIARMDRALVRVERVGDKVVDSVFERSAERSVRAMGRTRTERWEKVVRKPKVPVLVNKEGRKKPEVQLEETPMLEPRIYPNRIEFRRVIKLPILGQSYDHPSVISPIAQSPASPPYAPPLPLPPPPNNIRPVTRESNSQTHSQQDLEERPITAPDQDLTISKQVLLQKSPYKSAPDSPGDKARREETLSTGRNNLSSGSARPYHKDDIKYAGLPRDCRKGRFIPSPMAEPIDMRGRINRKSQHEISLERELQSNVTIQESLEKAAQERFRHTSLPLDQMRRTVRPPAEAGNGENKEDFRKMSSGPNSQAGSMVEKSSLPEVEPGIKVSGRSLSPSKAAIEHSSPLPSHTSRISTPHPQFPQPNPAQRVAVYDFKPYAHLLRPDNMPEKMEYEDPMEFLYALNVLKFKYNKAHESEFLRATERENVYESRRDELGGAIEQQDWEAFIQRIERLARVRARRRRLRRARRKRLGVSRKRREVQSLKPDVRRDKLWQAVFLTGKMTPRPPPGQPVHRPARYGKQL